MVIAEDCIQPDRICYKQSAVPHTLINKIILNLNLYASSSILFTAVPTTANVFYTSSVSKPVSTGSHICTVSTATALYLLL
jgi:hypothetical protein